MKTTKRTKSRTRLTKAEQFTTESWRSVEELLKNSLTRSLDALNLSRKADVDRLNAQIFDLESKLRDTRRALKKEITNLARELGASDSELARLNAEQLRLRPMALLSSMVPALAHDLNTPIGNANLVSSSLRELVAEFRTVVESGELRKSYLNEFIDDLDSGLTILCATAERAAEISGALKHVAIDYASMRRRTFEMSALVSDVLTTLHPSVRKTKVSITTHIDNDIEMISYPGPLEQVLTNLIQNALLHAFTQDSTGIIDLTASVEGDSVVLLRVSDNGSGISDAVQKKLFTPFFTTRPDAGGSGVGLNYARQLVEGPLGGGLELVSTLGVGTVITLSLPRIAPEQAVAA
jgi:signal transduction histidine kinase